MTSFSTALDPKGTALPPSPRKPLWCMVLTGPKQVMIFVPRIQAGAVFWSPCLKRSLLAYLRNVEELHPGVPAGVPPGYHQGYHNWQSTGGPCWTTPAPQVAVRWTSIVTARKMHRCADGDTTHRHGIELDRCWKVEVSCDKVL